MLGGGLPRGSDCVCSTSYASASPLLRSSCQRVPRTSTTLCMHGSNCSCWKRSPTAAFKGRQTRRNVARRALTIEARRTRPDPIIAPYIVRDQGGQEDYIDMYQHLMSNRIIFLGSRVTDDVATNLVAKLLALEAMNSEKDIKIYINSGGGSPYAIFGILDTLRFMKPEVSTICLGQCASSSTLLLAAGAKGKRLSLPSSRIMMHQPVGGAMGSADEVNITVSELNRTMRVVHKFYSQFTGQTVERMEQETDRDLFMSPKQAIELGLIDAII